MVPSILPASSTARRGWRTSSWRSVPRLYSLATCAAAMPKATTPSSIEARATPMTRPFGWASWCSVTIPPFAVAWENIRITKSEAAQARPRKVESSSVGRRSLVHSLVKAAHII